MYPYVRLGDTNTSAWRRLCFVTASRAVCPFPSRTSGLCMVCRWPGTRWLTRVTDSLRCSMSTHLTWSASLCSQRQRLRLPTWGQVRADACYCIAQTAACVVEVLRASRTPGRDSGKIVPCTQATFCTSRTCTGTKWKACLAKRPCPFPSGSVCAYALVCGQWWMPPVDAPWGCPCGGVRAPSIVTRVCVSVFHAGSIRLGHQPARC